MGGLSFVRSSGRSCMVLRGFFPKRRSRARAFKQPADQAHRALMEVNSSEDDEPSAEAMHKASRCASGRLYRLPSSHLE
jgi:hypothetical protein